MSDLRVAVVAEGPTDALVIGAALKAILASRTFILTRLQPDATRPTLGNGWCGVHNWCRDVASRGASSLETDVTLPGFDLFVVHVDADVATKRYGDCGKAAADAATSLPPLPCSGTCPPAAADVDAMRARLLAWLGFATAGPRTALCIPSKAIEAWLAAAVLDSSSALLRGIECNLGLEGQRAALPVAQRIRKGTKEYADRAATITSRWHDVCALCPEADRFTREIAAACPP